MVIVLTSISLVAALLLGLMHNTTAEPIARIEKQNLEDGIKKVLLGASAEQIKVEEWTEGDFTFYKARNTVGEEIGTAVRTAVQAFSPGLTVLVGFAPDGRILGYDVLKHGETPGLGANVGTWFQEGGKGCVVGKNPAESNLTVSKDGGDIDAITASTITSRAFLRAINMEYDALFKTTNANTGATQTY